MRFVRFIAFLSVALCLASCSRDPKVVRQKYLESGNKYFEKGKYKEASLMYRSSIKTDPKFGVAYYHFALTELKLQRIANAVGPLRRAIELLPPKSPEYVDANIKLAEILLIAANGADVGDRNAKILEEVRGIRDMLIKQNPNSFEGTKLAGDLDFNDAIQFAKKQQVPESKQKMEEAIATYRKALQIKQGDVGTMLALAKTLGMYSELGEAEQIYKDILEKDKTQLAAYNELYRLYSAEGKRQDAENILRRAIATHPNDYGLQTLLAAHYFTNNNRAEMTKVLNNLKSHFKDYPQAYLRAGDFYFRIGDADQAIRQYEEGMSADPSHRVEYEKHIIEALIRQGKTAQAYEKDLEILKSNPKDADARGLKASFLLDKGDIDSALTELQSVVTASPDNFVARFNLGRAYFNKGELEQARLQFESAIKLRQDYMPARLALTQLAVRRGDLDLAVKYAQENLKMNPNNGVSVLLEAAALLRKGNYDESRALLERILKTNPNQADTLLELGVLDLTQKRYKEAEEPFSKAYSVDPSNLRGLLGLAEIHFAQNQPDQAIRVVASEVQKKPSRADLKKALADVELRGQQYPKAIADYQSVLGRYRDAPADQADIYRLIGISYSLVGDLQSAIENLKMAHRLVPSNVSYMLLLADFYNRSGRQQEALASYRDAMKIDPNNAVVLNNLAYLMTNTGGNLDEALTLAQRAKQQLPNLMEVSDTIGWIYVKKNLSDSAIEVFRDLNSKVKDKSTFHYHYALALAQKGDKTDAAKELKSALQYKPDKSEENQIRELLQKVS